MIGMLGTKVPNEHHISSHNEDGQEALDNLKSKLFQAINGALERIYSKHKNRISKTFLSILSSKDYDELLNKGLAYCK
jgi:hypothetical protein